MKALRVLSVIGLALYLILQGVFYLAESTSPVLHATTGIVGLISGILILVSLSHWIDLRKE